MLDQVRRLNIAGILLTLFGAFCSAYALFNGYHGPEYGNVTADGSVSKMPGYELWESRNEHWGYAGLALVLIGRGLQVCALFVKRRSGR